MSGTNPVFLVRKAKKSSGQKDAVLWCSDDFEAANATLDYLLIKSGAKLKDYFKAVATNFPVVNELPPEGELSLTFCDFYQLGKDNMTWVQIPGVTLPSSEAVAVARQRIVDGVDTETGEIIQHDQASTEDNGDLPEHPQLTVVATMPFRHRVLAQHIGDGEYLYHVDAEQKKAILALEMDTDNSYIQNLLLAAENVEAFKKAIEHDIHKAVNAVKSVFPADGKTPELASVIQFLKTWFDTPHIDRGLLVKEWCKGNRVSAIQRTESGANAGGGNKTDRNPDYVHTLDTLDQEIALATLPMDFNIYELPGSVYRRAKEIVKKKESPFKEWSAALRATPGILDYSRAAIFALIRSAHPEFYHYPGRLQGYINAYLTESDHENPTAVTLTAARHAPEKDAVEEANRQLAAERGEYVEGISDPNDPKWVKTDAGKQEAEPELVKKVAAGIFDVSALMQNSSTHGTKQEAETTSDVQVQETVSDEKQTGDALLTSESDLGNGEEADTGEQADVDHNQPEVSQNNDSASHSEPETQQDAPEMQQEEPASVWPEYFEPGRYEGVPNEVYHAANGTSSTMVKDARVSLMYFEARHVSKTIQKERTKVLDMGNLVHALALQPEQLEKEFSIEPEIPEGALTTTATIRAVIDEHNASLPALLTADDIKALLEEYNATLPAPLPLGASVDESYASYEQLPEEFQRIENGTKHTAAAMKACIKEYNATLPPQVKTSGSRDALLEQLTIINPDLVAQEAQKPQPLKVSGTKADLIQAVKSVNPDAVFADELLDAWRENPEGKVLVTRQQLSTALAIQKALLNHPTAGKLLTHPNHAVEVSYFGIDEETGLEIRVRPDLEIDMGGLRIGADLKTISMWNIKQEGLRAKLHREIIERDYHLSAAMYCETAALDQFFWIFVNKDENYHWIAIIEASEELLELGMLEYRKAMRAIANGFDTGEWPAPITEDYAEELNDFDVRRLEALRVQA
ncbi:TPA: PD-(D/E)XK nuclease-like domain-containing protein [Citrobacter koseri]|uniref:RecE family exodeoxyribonuclease n=1 Tax=Citrobacter TaxID=544 RepID=UPI0008DD05C9|nr:MULTISPECIES: RecE family exodeoxyribonuclease [Citrobacter]MDM3051897.1 PD-(D/E)XK nuclease-like domain-containing protein [Citrobacter sp. CK183]MDM9064704.1 PD-(D/E)XK nuclease-like domain-containing protein [Citrobacter koseri]MDM9079019.1 PD-(D/E)XK nuclease-like domain-containing protein [Citrobacter koseri]MDM9090009.1 PD-(D/E)XK nuclease-like domain-containing protein [Citrobacter koseri]MDM9096154.1 PD-(D/E)XK nuclease-like domain-containing protein [Citrobacter koseri]